MEIQKPDWSIIELCSFYLKFLDDRLLEAEHSLEKDEEKQKIIYNLKYFYRMVFNVSFYQFALAYSEVQEFSQKIIDDYLNNKKKEDNFFGGENDKF